MPDSIRENDSDVLAFVAEHGIKSVLDIGAGMGTYGKLLKSEVAHIDAVEVWQPYIDMFNLRYVYDQVIQADARHLGSSDFENYDMVIFGDVLEHMTAEESLAVWDMASVARFTMLSVPIIHFPQGELWNNPYEVHQQEHLHPEDLERDYGPFVARWEYQITGTFIKENDWQKRGE